MTLLKEQSFTNSKGQLKKSDLIIKHKDTVNIVSDGSLKIGAC